MLLKQADAAYESSRYDGGPEAGIAEYRKALIPHLWAIAQAHRRNRELKARILGWGQGLFLGFLGMLLFICLLFSRSIYGAG